MLLALPTVTPAMAQDQSIGEQRPALVVLLVFDQLRADYMTRFHDQFIDPEDDERRVAGFRYLLDRGAYFPYAEHDIIHTMTAPGHANISTGAYPYRHHIALNNSWDRAADDVLYSVEDAAHTLVGVEQTTVHTGTSPSLLHSSTIGDEFQNAGFASRVVSISIKDRAAILLGGRRADRAIWYDKPSHQWVSSTYYVPDGDLPSWIDQINSAAAAARGNTLTWTVEDTVLSDHGPAAIEMDVEDGSAEMLRTGFGPEMTARVAQAAVVAEDLGDDAVTDLLAVSFSSLDYMGHDFGPNSAQAEGQILAADRAVSDLLNTIDSEVPGGLDNVLVVMTGDHGVSPHPDYVQEHGWGGGHLPIDDLTERINRTLELELGALPDGARWCPAHFNLNWFLNRPAILATGHDIEVAEQIAAQVLAATDGVRYVVTRSDMAAGRLPPGRFGEQVRNQYVPDINGDLLVIVEPYFMHDVDPDNHITGYSFDRLVPLAFAGWGVRPGRYAQTVEVIDIAPTITYLVGVLPPSMSEGRVLHEIIADSPR